MWAEFCYECGHSVIQYYDEETHRLTSQCSRCRGRNTKVLREESERINIENAYFEKLAYRREMDNYIYGIKHNETH